MTIHIYAEHTIRAGQLCQDEDLIERKSDDVMTITGSRKDLSTFADGLASRRSSFGFRAARTIRSELECAE